MFSDPVPKAQVTHPPWSLLMLRLSARGDMGVTLHRPSVSPEEATCFPLTALCSADQGCPISCKHG